MDASTAHAIRIRAWSGSCCTSCTTQPASPRKTTDGNTWQSPFTLPPHRARLRPAYVELILREVSPSNDVGVRDLCTSHEGHAVSTSMLARLRHPCRKYLFDNTLKISFVMAWDRSCLSRIIKYVRVWATGWATDRRPRALAKSRPDRTWPVIDRSGLGATAPVRGHRLRPTPAQRGGCAAATSRQRYKIVQRQNPK
jgi:hypothetical protein